MGKTSIEWCDKVYNPITGCNHAGSPGCDHCYAKRMAYRLKGRFGYPKDDPFKVTFHPDRLNEPLHWKKASRIFVCSMGDLFHDEVSDGFLFSIFGIMGSEEVSHHSFLILTKRPKRMADWIDKFKSFGIDPSKLFKRVWLGVSVENQRTADERIPILCQIPAAIKFVSVEPMLENINLYRGWFGLNGINWMICGGETGPKPRRMNPDWVRWLKAQCQGHGIPFFFKGMMITGGYERIPHKTYLLDGKEWREFPK